MKLLNISNPSKDDKIEIYIDKYEIFYIDDDNIKPLLRPISDMTEEECDKLFEILKINEESGKEWIKINDIGIIRLFTEVGKDFYEIAEAMDYLRSIHVDFRWMIDEGIATAYCINSDKN